MIGLATLHNTTGWEHWVLIAWLALALIAIAYACFVLWKARRWI